MDHQRSTIIVVYLIMVVFLLDDYVSPMSTAEKRQMKNQVIEMFDHAYNSYMDHAYPGDELMPLSCRGRYRGTEPSRGDIDDTLGNFTLSLIDSLDTLAILGKLEEFEKAVKLVIRDARFDSDCIVSVFETNIRVLGGLLGGHVVASYLKKKKKVLKWYNNELLEKARDVGDRLLPAFNTTTGIPYPRINLKSGVNEFISSSHRDTCTACAGTMILEFAALSRLTGDPKYEDKAHKAMDYLWQQRHRTSDLMGLVINIHNGDWIRRESGVGAGIDSYYEYVLKAYILLGDETYLDRFNKHYDAVMKYVSQGPLLVDVHMHKPLAVSRNFMDALLAFWPGLQVLKGDIRHAIETHEMLYQVMQRHNFLPEAFTTDFRVHWGHHPLRPELVESTYFLYQATGDPHYLEVGKMVMENLNKHAKVDCGFAAIKDVTTGTHEDQMDSYVLAETFKYLYLLFAENEDHTLDIEDYIFTTEAHLLPLTLSVHNSPRPVPKIRPESYLTLEENLQTEQTSGLDLKENDCDDGTSTDAESTHNTCPNFHVTLPGGPNFAQALRSQMKNMVDRISPRPKRMRSRLKAGDFIAGNKDQLEILHQMGIRIATMSDGRIQLLHTASEAATPEDAEDGMRFMQEMIELSKTQPQEAQHEPMYVQVVSPPFYGAVFYRAGPAQFGYDLKSSPPIQAGVAVTEPFKGCSTILNPEDLVGKIAMLERGECMFVDKARNIQKAGALGGIVVDHNEGSSGDTQSLFAMSGDGQDDITIPLVFLFKKEGQELLSAKNKNPFLEVVLARETKPQDAFLPSDQGGPAGPEMTDQQSQEDSQQDDKYLPDQHPPPLGALKYHPEEGHPPENMGAYTLKAGSRKVHMQVKITADSTDKIFNQVNDKKDILQLDILPDGSKQLVFKLDQTGEDKTRSKPQLNQIYVDLVQILQDKTNFQTLQKQGDYLIAIARLLESAYFGMNSVDLKAQELVEQLAVELKFLKDTPSQTKTDFSDKTKDDVDSQTAREHYANTADLYENKNSGQKSSYQSKQQTGNNPWIQLVPPDKSANGFGASFDQNGVLKFADENAQTEAQHKSFSVEEPSIIPHESVAQDNTKGSSHAFVDSISYSQQDDLSRNPSEDAVPSVSKQNIENSENYEDELPGNSERTTSQTSGLSQDNMPVETKNIPENYDESSNKPKDEL